MVSRGLLAAAFAAPFALSSTPARAYSTESVVSDGCHEQITFSALRRVREELVTAAPLPPGNDDEKALIEDTPFSIPADMRDLASVTAVLGNRNVDLKHHEPDDLEFLAQVHGNPANQDEHCLRSNLHDDPSGDQTALDACRAYIRGRALAALDGLDAQGMPDPGLRTKGDIYLELRGAIEANVPTYWWEIGRALHTMQDSFSHTYRSQQDPLKVIAILNYVEFVEDELDESIDGPPHSSGLDRCKDIDTYRQERIQRASDASVDLLRATLDPALDRAAKEDAVDQMLTRYLSYQAGCNAENSWCDAPEQNYPEERGCVCSLPGAAGQRSSGAWWALAAVAGVVLVRRRRIRSRAALTAGAALGIALMPSLAQAQETMPPPEEPPTVVMERDTPRPVDEDVIEKEEDYFPLGVHGAAGASIANPAGAASLGLRYRLSEHFLIGADGEYNPFYSDTNKELKPGVTNIYATAIVRFPMTFEDVNLRSTFNAGISRMNFDLYGVPEGTVGPFFGFNLLGVDIELAKQFYLVINPAYVAIPIPQTKGVPYTYPQYRISIGFQVGA